MEGIVAPRALSGRWMAIGLALVLLVGTVGGFLTIQRFQRIMGALDEARQRWPNAASELEARYLAIDDEFHRSASQANDSAVPIDAWRAARRAFQASTQYDVQVQAVEHLERLAGEIHPESTNDQGAVKLSPSLANFLEADRKLESLRIDTLGWLCMQLIRLTLPDPIHQHFDVGPSKAE